MTDLQECIGGMEMEKFYLGFDAGTQSVKVTVYNEKMECVASTSAPTTLTYPHPGWVDMDVDEYLALTINGMAECSRQMREKGLDPKQIQSIMGDGIICGIAGVDEEGNAITPYINYLDSRTQEDEVLINSWDLDIWGRETGNPEAKCMFPALFARWLLKNNEAFKARGAKFIHNAPYVLAHLAGLKAKDMFIDWGAMSGWGMGYKVEEKCWSPEQLKILGIEASMMPKIVKPWDIVGHLTEEMAEKTGLAAGTPICRPPCCSSSCRRSQCCPLSSSPRCRQRNRHQRRRHGRRHKAACSVQSLPLQRSCSHTPAQGRAEYPRRQ